MGPARSHCATLLDARQARFQVCPKGKTQLWQQTLLHFNNASAKNLFKLTMQIMGHAKLISC